MNTRTLLMTAFASLSLWATGIAVAQTQTGQQPAPYIRLAELDIDPAQMEDFKAAVTEGVQAAIRVEPGVLALYVVFEKENPNRVRVFEMYTDPQAYQTHLATPHFRKFRDTTDKMVTSRKLLDGVPVVLGAKPSGSGKKFKDQIWKAK